MTEQLTIHSSTTIRPRDPGVIEWWADSDAGMRHAFPRREGFPARAWCGERWTAAFGKAGSGTCPDCLAVLRSAIKSHGQLGPEIAPETELEKRASWGDR